jgi:hypothetical protein
MQAIREGLCFNMNDTFVENEICYPANIQMVINVRLPFNPMKPDIHLSDT